MSMSWTKSPLSCLDFEATDKFPETARIVTAYLSTIDLIGGKAEVNGMDWLLDPGCEISDEAAAIHGVTTEIAQRDGDDYEEGVLAIHAALSLSAADGRIVAIYNASYDVTLLWSEMRRMGHDPGEVPPIIDPFCIDRALDKFRKGKRTLTAVCEHYGVELGDAHQADADALAAARLAWKMPRVYPELAKLSVEELQSQQAAWHAERQRDFREYRERQGLPVDDISEAWPIRTAA